MDYKLLIAVFYPITTLLAFNTFGQNDSINEYKKIESIDNRLEELKRSLKSMQKQSSPQRNSYISNTAPTPVQTPKFSPKENSKNQAINPVVENIIIEPQRNEVRPTEELKKRISDRISKIQTITETEAPMEDDLDDNLPLEPEPIFYEEKLDEVPLPLIEETGAPPLRNMEKESSAQKAYNALVKKRKEKLWHGSDKDSLDSPASLDNENKTELPIRVSSVKPIFKRNERHVPYSERKFPRNQTPVIEQEVLFPTTEPSITPGPVDSINTVQVNKNSFNFYYGFSIPNLSEYKGDTIKFKDGQEFSFEYLRDYGYLSLGLGYSFKSFENERWSIPGVTTDISGDNTLHSFKVSVGMEPEVNNLIFLRAKFSGGFAIRNH